MSPERCKKTIYTNRGFSNNRCHFKVYKDGYCKRHSPEAAEKRRKKSESTFEAREVRMRSLYCSAAIKEAQRQAYLDCVRICQALVGYDQCIEAIQSRMKELGLKEDE